MTTIEHFLASQPWATTVVACVVFVLWSAVWRVLGLWLDKLKPANLLLAKLVAFSSAVAHLLATRTPPKTLAEAKQDAVDAAKAAAKTVAVLLLCTIPFASGCATIKPIVHTLNDAAVLECQAWASGKLQVPMNAKAVADFCAIQGNLAPFIAHVTAVHKAGKEGLPPEKVGCGE